MTVARDQPAATDAARARAALVALRAEVAKAVIGQDAAVTGLVIALLCRGHVLLEGVPGVAKTLLVRALAAAEQRDDQSGDRCVLADHGLGDFGAEGDQRRPGSGRVGGGRLIPSDHHRLAHWRRTSSSRASRASARRTSAASSCGGGPYSRSSTAADGPRTPPLTASVTAAGDASGGSPSESISRDRAPERSASAARSRAPATRYSRARPSTASAARTTTGSDSATTGPRRRARHNAINPTPMSSWSRAGRTQAGSSSVTVRS